MTDDRQEKDNPLGSADGWWSGHHFHGTVAFANCGRPECIAERARRLRAAFDAGQR